ncbi:phospholipase/carboxylesterase family protein-like protein [Dothidotthia symphoricarpi CBS 119687]|uniref:Phospholipase/carboxylesterase family protein-like protein n=1 Tax=Dothidotthia symphoricarpi CBS 119687 TaxID=1392245 RepID=A0A6A6ANA8_9PLEO|nr:phospholipase/carboxylesterase family protein-like protein [Dothidotthia symphoricarpi CBS 119687]KAF2132424.1 phospholipase/carboxylesterase family protein-like protein [Dothidotthia symphoricarpi CBS 119687]
MSNPNSKTPVNLPPLVFPPLQNHRTTLIILHGRGSTAQKFAEPLLKHAVSPSGTGTTSSTESPAELLKSFQDYFPDTKFVFPTAPLRRAVVFKRSLTHQWFDNWSLTQPELKQHLQVQGLRETTVFLHELLREEIAVVGAGNVVLMGLSQGCAASIVATLLWKGEAFGAVVGMCGYLPFRKGMCEFAEEAGKEDNESLVGSGAGGQDIFERDGEDSEDGTKFEKAVEWLREELQMCDEGITNGKSPSTMQSIPLFMGHGLEDDKVPSGIGRLAAEFLSSIDVDVTWKEYEGLGHWYSEHMLRDVVRFLKNLNGWTDAS